MHPPRLGPGRSRAAHGSRPCAAACPHPASPASRIRAVAHRRSGAGAISVAQTILNPQCTRRPSKYKRGVERGSGWCEVKGVHRDSSPICRIRNRSGAYPDLGPQRISVAFQRLAPPLSLQTTPPFPLPRPHMRKYVPCLPVPAALPSRRRVLSGARAGPSHTLFFAFTLALWRISVLMTSRLPKSAALCSGVLPFCLDGGES